MEAWRDPAFAAVNGFHVQGMSQDERNVLCLAQVGDPVPGEQALDGNDDIGAIGGERVQEQLLAGRDLRLQDNRACVVEDANGQQPCVQVNAAVKSMGLAVETHGMRLLWVARHLLLFDLARQSASEAGSLRRQMRPASRFCRFVRSAIGNPEPDWQGAKPQGRDPSSNGAVQP